MQELIDKVTQATGLDAESSEVAVVHTIKFLVERIPDPFSDLVEAVLQGYNLRDWYKIYVEMTGPKALKVIEMILLDEEPPSDVIEERAKLEKIIKETERT